MSLLEHPLPVTLHLYEVGSHSPVFKAKRTFRIVGTGVFHVAVEVAGKEWSYAYCEATIGGRSGIFYEIPKECDIHEYMESFSMPPSKLSAGDVEDALKTLRTEWHGEEYDLLRRNCCHFSEVFCQALGVGPVPCWIANLAGTWATMRDQNQKLGRPVVNEDVLTSAKAGLEVDPKFLEGGTIKARAVDLYRTGQQILDTGGVNAKQWLSAKKVSCEAVEKETALTKALAVTAELYQDAASLLDAADTSSAKADGNIALQARAELFKKVQGMLAESMSMPEVLPAEIEAVQLMEVRSRRLQPFAAAKARLKNVQQGKEILDQGGDRATQQIVAKQVAKDAALTDKHVIEHLPIAKAIYDDAVERLVACKDVLPEVDGPSLEAFTERAAMYQAIVEMLLQPVESPTLSAAERDAAMLIAGTDRDAAAQKRLSMCTSINHGAMYQGNLKKRGPSGIYGWQERWCVLFPNKLSCFQDSTMRVLKSDIEITTRSRLIPFVNSHEAPGESAKYCKEKPFGFVWDSDPSAGKDRQLFYFEAESDNEMKLWITAVEAVMRNLRVPGAAFM